jgi:hypothetical protein
MFDASWHAFVELGLGLGRIIDYLLPKDGSFARLLSILLFFYFHLVSFDVRFGLDDVVTDL